MGTLKSSLTGFLPTSFAGKSVLVLLIFGFLIRLLVSNYIVPSGDFEAWVRWGEPLALYGPTQFYERVSNDRLPGGILFLLWLLASLRQAFPFLSNEILYKLPGNVADLILACLVFQHVRIRWGGEAGIVASLLYFFNPFTWYISSIWAQMDSVQALLLTLSMMGLVAGRVALSTALLTYAFLFKPHSIVLVPLLILVLFIRSVGVRSLAKNVVVALLSGLTVMWVSGFPFALTRIDVAHPHSFLLEPLRLVWERYNIAYNLYPYGSVNSLNLWHIFGQNWQSDAALFFGVTYRHWGIALFLLFSAVLLWRLFKVKDTFVDKRSLSYYTVAALLMLFSFTFLTRAHERHVYPFFALLVFDLFSSRARVVSYLLMTVLSLVNATYTHQGIWGIHLAHSLISEGGRAFFSLIPLVASFILLLDVVRSTDLMGIKKQA